MLAMRRIGTPETTPLRLNAPNHPACVRVRKRNNAAAPRLIVIMSRGPLANMDSMLKIGGQRPTNPEHAPIKEPPQETPEPKEPPDPGPIDKPPAPPSPPPAKFVHRLWGPEFTSTRPRRYVRSANCPGRRDSTP
jgi:hypothetical protein